MMYQKLLLLWGKALYSPNTVEDCHKGTWLMEIINDEIIWTEVKIVFHEQIKHILLTILGIFGSHNSMFTAMIKKFYVIISKSICTKVHSVYFYSHAAVITDYLLKNSCSTVYWYLHIFEVLQ